MIFRDRDETETRNLDPEIREIETKMRVSSNPASHFKGQKSWKGCFLTMSTCKIFPWKIWQLLGSPHVRGKFLEQVHTAGISITKASTMILLSMTITWFVWLKLFAVLSWHRALLYSVPKPDVKSFISRDTFTKGFFKANRPYAQNIIPISHKL